MDPPSPASDSCRTFTVTSLGDAPVCGDKNSYRYRGIGGKVVQLVQGLSRLRVGQSFGNVWLPGPGSVQPLPDPLIR